MKIRKLESINAFVAVDLEDTPGRGVVRTSKKILQGGAKDLARSSLLCDTSTAITFRHL